MNESYVGELVFGYGNLIQLSHPYSIVRYNNCKISK